jgi:hypothetical protein
MSCADLVPVLRLVKHAECMRPPSSEFGFPASAGSDAATRGIVAWVRHLEPDPTVCVLDAQLTAEMGLPLFSSNVERVTLTTSPR